MATILWLLVGIWLLIVVVKWVMRAPDSICRDCGTTGEPGARGSGWIELVLWVFTFGVIGIVYSIWRRTGKGQCRACGSDQVVPLSSPFGKQLAAKGAA